LVKTRLLPNQLSSDLGVGILGAWFAARGGYGNLLLGAFLFQRKACWTLRWRDEPASVTAARAPVSGRHRRDDLTNYGFFAGSAWGLYKMSHNPLYLWRAP